MALMARSAALAERLTFGLSALWTNVVLKAIGKVVGLDVLGDVWSFYRDIDPIREPLSERARATFDLMRGPETAYLVVTRAEAWLLEETRTLKRALEHEGCRVGGVVVNRLVDVPPSRTEPEKSVPCVGLEEGLALRVRRAAGLMERLAVSQRTVVDGLRKALGGRTALVTLRELEAEVYEIAGIERIRRALFGRRQDG